MGDTKTGITFHLTAIDRTLRELIGDREPDVFIEIPHHIAVDGYYSYVVNALVDSFADLWASGTYVLPSDIAIPGWREIQFDHEMSYEITEEFIGASITSGLIGQYGWETSGPATITSFSENGHPGIIRLSSTFLTPTYLLFPTWFKRAVISEMTMIIRPQVPSETNLAYGQWAMGLTDQAGNATICSLSNALGQTSQDWRLSHIFGVGNVVERQSEIDAEDGHWYEFRLSRLTPNSFHIRVSDLTDRLVNEQNLLFTTTVPNESMLQPYVMVRSHNGSTAQLDIDFMRLQIAGLTRGA